MTDGNRCCAPSRGGGGPVVEPVTTFASGVRATTVGMARLDAAAFVMGSDDAWAYPEDGEGPRRDVELSVFWIDRCAVTNDDFGTFVDETAYVTEAERFGWSFVFAGLLPDEWRRPWTPEPWRNSRQVVAQGKLDTFRNIPARASPLMMLNKCLTTGAPLMCPARPR